MSASELQKAIDRLIKREPGWAKFQPAPAVGGRLGAKSTGRPSSGAGVNGAGIAEKDFSEREYWPMQLLTTTDGLLTFEIEPIKSILLDTGDRATFKEPT